MAYAGAAPAGIPAVLGFSDRALASIAMLIHLTTGGVSNV
jgi:hypothetical protein